MYYLVYIYYKVKHSTQWVYTWSLFNSIRIVQISCIPVMSIVIRILVAMVPVLTTAPVIQVFRAYSRLVERSRPETSLNPNCKRSIGCLWAVYFLPCTMPTSLITTWSAPTHGKTYPYYAENRWNLEFIFGIKARELISLHIKKMEKYLCLQAIRIW